MFANLIICVLVHPLTSLFSSKKKKKPDKSPYNAQFSLFFIDSSMQYRCIIHLNNIIGPAQRAELGFGFSLQNHRAINFITGVNVSMGTYECRERFAPF